MRSKRFRLVLDQRKTEERDFWFWPREKWIESPPCSFTRPSFRQCL